MEVFFFEILANSAEDYECKICRAADSSQSFNAGQVLAGYTNLLNHLKELHKNTWEKNLLITKFKQYRFRKWLYEKFKCVQP